MALAQIQANKEYQPFEPICLDVEATIPSGAQVEALWEISKPASYIPKDKTKMFVWAPPGVYEIECIVIITKLVKIEGEELPVLISFSKYKSEFKVLELSPDPDEPPPEPPTPTPDIPEDRFDNLGQRVGEWSSSLPRKAEIAENYRIHADALRKPTNPSPSSVSESMVASRTRILGPEKVVWSSFLSQLEEDLRPRASELTRQDLIDYWEAIANGLDPK